MKYSTCLFISCLLSWHTNAQTTDSLKTPVADTLSKNKWSYPEIVFAKENTRSFLHSLVVPAVFIGYGFYALNNEELKKMDTHIKEEIWIDHPHRQITIDNYLQYSPVLAAYGLHALGIRGENNLRDMSMIYLLSNAIMGATVFSIKKITRIQRPDGYGTNAFPSGHTATAFTAAELLRQEYKNVSPWYAVGGYTAAITTAYLRMYNNKHWFRDLLPGAGIGIISTRLAYRIYPFIKEKLFGNKPSSLTFSPFYQNKIAGLSFVYSMGPKK